MSEGAEAGGPVHRRTRRTRRSHAAHAAHARRGGHAQEGAPVQQDAHVLQELPPPCPSVLDVACFEAGDLTEFQRAVLTAHARQCFRCGLSVAELREARNEILGPTPDVRTLSSKRAAEEIETILRQRLH